MKRARAKHYSECHCLRGVYGRYVYGDLCKSTLRAVKLGRRRGASGDHAIGVSVKNLVAFGQDGRGRLYTVSIDGAVSRLIPR